MIDTAYIVRSISPAEVIERYTGNRPQHNKYLCPFHRDKHPSLSVKTDIWRCWSCGKGGNVINFVQEYFGLGFVDACRKLNDDFNLGLNLDPPAKVSIWEQVKRESDEYNRQQLKRIREEIDNEIDLLTTAHRVLLRYGAPQEVLNNYINDIEDLSQYKQFWR